MTAANNKGLTDQLIDIIDAINRSTLTEQAVSKFRQCLVDYLGVTFAGSHNLQSKDQRIVRGSLDNAKEVAPIGWTEKCSLTNAIFINGLNSHFLELDDGVRYGVVHPGAPIFSALLPLAVVHKVSWDDLMVGVISGYEAAIRISSAVQPHHYSKGYHPTATCCTLGVAVGIAKMLGYSRTVLKDAFSAATVSGYGTLKVLEDVSQLKPYNCAKAALMGYYSALMAEAGFRGPSEPLLGSTGFLEMMAGKWKEDVLLADNDFYYIEKVYIKPYASCRHTHPEIEAACWIRQQAGFDFDKISAVNIKTYKGVLGKHDIYDITGEAAARMSIPFSVAVALSTGKAGIAEFAAPYVADPRLLALLPKIKIEGDEYLSSLVPDKRGAVVEVVMDDGQKWAFEVLYPKGEPENPLSNEELWEKFSSMMTHANVSASEAKTLFDDILLSESPSLCFQ